MKNGVLVRYDKAIALIFGALSVLFIVLAAVNEEFFTWMFARHHNQLSWYIRPLFLVPFCFFAYKRSWAGISCTVFLLLTSMFWFPEPASVNEKVRAFLDMEQEYLTGEWTFTKVLITLLVPASMTALAAALWKRSLWLGISVLVFIALAKMLWSVVFGGSSGGSVMIPAIVGLAVCIVLIYIGFRKLEKKKEDK